MPRRSLIAVVGPGLMLAATGVGAADLAGGAFAGMALGTAVMWAVVLGAFFKFVITEGLTRWQLATGTTLLEGMVLHLGRPVQWLFLVYLLVWTFGVGTSLAAGCGVAGHALLPVFEDPAHDKVFWGVIHSCAGLVLVLVGSFRLFERIMVLLVVAMVGIVLTTGWLLRPPAEAMMSGLFVPLLPDKPEAVEWTLALMGGVGGTLTVLCYGYWIREEKRTTVDELRLCRFDLAISYAVMALFGIAMIIIASGMELSGQKGATLIVDLSERLEAPLGSFARRLFLLGGWAAIFSSLIGVWQSVPYLFADFWQLFRNYRNADAGKFQSSSVNTRGWAYRGYLLLIAFVPLLGLRYDFQVVQKLNSVFGALVMPMLALALLILNGRTAWVGAAHRNRWWTAAALLAVLCFFLWVGVPKIWSTLAS